ncbi:hypothetical protein Goshw_005831, partial [Gossypium schwendimanii]|nr:hypothetical protein [Gossypium schwendimanii]
MGDFIGKFMEYDSAMVTRGGGKFMRIRVLLDIRKPLKRKKRVSIEQNKFIYVIFQYERLSLFCFICGRLGHGESFCEVRLTLENQQVEFGWDFSLRAMLRRGGQAVSKWLREDTENEKWNDMEIDGERRLRRSDEEGINRTELTEERGALGRITRQIRIIKERDRINLRNLEEKDFEEEMEDLPVELVDGKKRQRINPEKVSLGYIKNLTEGNVEINLSAVTPKVTSKRMESIRIQCGFTCGIDVAAVGTSGGLSLGWKEGGNVSLKSFSKSHIDVEIENEEEMGSWRLTGFYGEPKKWGRIRDERQMNAFRETLEYCDLYDLGFSGQWYTWERGRLANNNTRERLDRGVANMEWWDLFPKFKWHFRFDANWILNEEIEERITREWNSNNLDVLEKLKKVGTNLSTWVKKEKRRKEQRMKDLNGRLLKLGACDISDAILEEITEIKLDLNLEADKEELFWEQRARVNWLQMGDKNTAFYHKNATHRRRKNRIQGLENEEHNSILVEEFKEEVVRAIKSMSPLKASGQDGFPAIFYHKYWHVVGEGVSKYCLDVLNGRRN